MEEAPDIFDIEDATEVTDREIAEYMCYYAAELPPTALVRLSRDWDIGY